MSVPALPKHGRLVRSLPERVARPVVPSLSDREEDPSMTVTNKLRALLAQPAMLAAPGAYDCVSARAIDAP